MKNIVLDGLNVGEQIFEGGIVKTAVINLSNHSILERTYDVELYLSSAEDGSVKNASSGVGTLTVPPNDTISIQFTLTLPEDEGEYFVFLSVLLEGKRPITYKARNKVMILPPQEVEVSFMQWQ